MWPSVFEPQHDGRIYIEKINPAVFSSSSAIRVGYTAQLEPSDRDGWLGLHESDAYVKFTRNGSHPNRAARHSLRTLLQATPLMRALLALAKSG